jgi:hypothetical protein
LNSPNPSWRSSYRINTLTPEGVMKSFSAARAKLWCWATKWKALNCRDVNSIDENIS